MRMKFIAQRVLKQLVNDKRTLLLMLVAPLLILTLMDAIFNFKSDSKINIGVYNIDPAITKVLLDNDINIKEYTDNHNVRTNISDDNLDAFISFKDNIIDVTYENSDPVESLEISSKINIAMTKFRMDTLTDISKKQANLIKSQSDMLSLLTSKIELVNQIPDLKTSLSSETLNINNHYIYGDKDTNMFDTIVPILIGFFVFFFVFLISGISLLKERTSWTLDKLLATPVKRSEIVYGYLIGYGVFAVIQTIIMILFSIYGLNIEVVGSLGLVFLINIVTAFVALPFGILLSTFANSEFQMMQFIPIAILPQIFLSGIIPIDTMWEPVQYIAKLLPMYYCGDALREVFIKGSPFSSIAPDLFILILFAIVFTILNIVGLRRYRKV